MPWELHVATNVSISSANHLKVRFIQQSRSHQQRIREDKYQQLGNALDRVKEIRKFLDGVSPTEKATPAPEVRLRREVNQHLTRFYGDSPGIYATKAAIYAISQHVDQKKQTVNLENFTRLTTDIHTMIDVEKPLGEITNQIIDFKIYHRLNSLP